MGSVTLVMGIDSSTQSTKAVLVDAADGRVVDARSAPHPVGTEVDPRAWLAAVDRATGEVSYGRVPAGSVVISGSLPKDGGKYSLYAAIIVKRVDAQTRAKTSLNELLRD